MDQFKAVVLSGSPFSVNQIDSPDIDLKMIMGSKPVIAICYGAQLVAKKFNGSVKNSNSREYGRANLSFIDQGCSLFEGINIIISPCFPKRELINFRVENDRLSSLI